MGISIDEAARLTKDKVTGKIEIEGRQPITARYLFMAYMPSSSLLPREIYSRTPNSVGEMTSGFFVLQTDDNTIPFLNRNLWVNKRCHWSFRELYGSCLDEVAYGATCWAGQINLTYNAASINESCRRYDATVNFGNLPPSVRSGLTPYDEWVPDGGLTIKTLTTNVTSTDRNRNLHLRSAIIQTELLARYLT